MPVRGRIESTITRRGFLGRAGAIAGLVCAPFVPRSLKAQNRTIIYNGWGGTFDEALTESFFKPLLRDTGIEVKIFAPQTFALLKKQVETGVYQFDFADYNDVRARQASIENLLEPVDFKVVQKAKLPPAAVASAPLVNGIAFSCLSLNLVYNKKKFPNGGPNSWADFWNVDKFPGKRGFMKGAAGDRMIAAALLADGVPKDKLYPLDMARAAKKLAVLKPHLKVIWDSSPQGMQLLRDEEVDMTPIWGGRAWQLIDQGIPLEVVWNEAFIANSNWIVAKGSPSRADAWRAIDFTCDPERLAKFGRITFQGPLHPKSFEYLSEKEGRRMPSHPENWTKGVIQEVVWTGENLNNVMKQFNQWLAS